MSYQGSYQPNNSPMYSQQQPPHHYNTSNYNYPQQLPLPQQQQPHHYNNNYNYAPQQPNFPPSPQQYAGPPSPFDYTPQTKPQPQTQPPQQPPQPPLLRLPNYMNGRYNAVPPIAPFNTPPRPLPYSHIPQAPSPSNQFTPPPPYAYPQHPQHPLHPMAFYTPQKPSPLRFQPYPIHNQNPLIRRSGGPPNGNHFRRVRVVLNPDGSLPAGISFFKHSFLENPWQTLEATMDVKTTFIPLPSTIPFPLNAGKPLPYQPTLSKIENRSQLPDLSELLTSKLKPPPILKQEDQKTEEQTEQTKPHQFAENKGSFERENIQQQSIGVQKNDQPIQGKVAF